MEIAHSFKEEEAPKMDFAPQKFAKFLSFAHQNQLNLLGIPHSSRISSHGD